MGVHFNGTSRSFGWSNESEGWRRRRGHRRDGNYREHQKKKKKWEKVVGKQRNGTDEPGSQTRAGVKQEPTRRDKRMSQLANDNGGRLSIKIDKKRQEVIKNQPGVSQYDGTRQTKERNKSTRGATVNLKGI